ncbi:MAG: GNAT family N-acetyltransferase [Candidatus Delongbacteria bacterium]|nr:GNAT family N-acetyltransferase [Candidatus Delongbacteria bacterium]
MKFVQYFEIKEFKSKVMPFLEKNEDKNNLAIGILKKLVINKNNYSDSDPFTAIIDDKGIVLLVLLMTPPYNLQLIGEKIAIETAVEGLLKANISIPGIIGRKELCRIFEKIWTEQTDCKSETAMDQRIYRLDKVESVLSTEGHFKIADENDAELLTEWMIAFNDYINEDVDKERARKSIQNLISKQRAYIWVDNEPVSMCLGLRETFNGITVSGVYTPEKFRRKGYATSCVAQASKILLDEGYKYCTLYTDLSNPTSNSIYQKIGYKPIADSVMIKFN